MLQTTCLYAFLFSEENQGSEERLGIHVTRSMSNAKNQGFRPVIEKPYGGREGTLPLQHGSTQQTARMSTDAADNMSLCFFIF
jgi:hypothetical protein